MPTYEYRCANGHEFEKFYRTISASEAEVPCPECGATATRQLSAGGGLLFKGSGFYLTDYGRNAHQTRGDGKAPAAGSGNAKAGGPGTPGGTSGSDAGGSTPPKASEGKTTGGAPSGADKSTPKKGD
jgi:putative FmdB family regulatory protein